jgi:transposase
LAERHDVTLQTIRHWLRRFTDQPIHEAPYAEVRSGRPPKLTDDKKAEFFADLHNSPEYVGFDRQVWFPLLAYRHLKATYDVEYSMRQVYRLLHEA